MTYPEAIRHSAVALVISTMGCWSAAAQLPGETGNTVDAFVRRSMKRQMIPGLSLGVLRAGRLVHTAGYGLADVENDVPARPETVYQSGSVAKPFAAMAVMLLVEDGELALEDPIGRHLGRKVPAWPTAASI